MVKEVLGECGFTAELFVKVSNSSAVSGGKAPFEMELGKIATLTTLFVDFDSLVCTGTELEWGEVWEKEWFQRC